MKIGFYNPYFDSLGGGERYMLTLASHWSSNHEVSVFWDDASMLERANTRFGLDLSNVRVAPNIFRYRHLIRKLAASAQYDCIVVLSDGSVPTSLARTNILHMQVPFASVPMPSWKRKQYQAVVCNSQFTKAHLDHTLAAGADVIYPPVDTDAFPSGKKSNVIASVGRFSSHYQAKKQEVLISAFREGIATGELTGWKLVLAGGVLAGDEDYLESLRRSADGLPIEFMPDCTFDALKDLYATAAIYWHAAGFGETDPATMEHFGMTTVEAMTAGCVPVVYAAGGQPEIVHDGKDGMLWNTVPELLSKTADLIHDPEKTASIVAVARTRSRDFGTLAFHKAFDDVLRRIAP